MPLRTSLFFGAMLALSLISPAWSNSGGYSLVGDGSFFMRTSTTEAPERGRDRSLGSGRSRSLGGNLGGSLELGAGRSPATDDTTGRGAVSLNPSAASLFRGRSGGSLFASPVMASVDVAEIMNVIAQAEAGRADYDAVQHGARIKPPAPPTQMTLQQIYTWIKDTPGQSHAIGRYQFIPATLKRLAGHQGVPLNRRFNAALQDQLAHQLIEEAGLSAFKAGKMEQVTFMNNLAKIWAGLPTSSGKSHYHNYAGNKATVTWASFKAQMDQIFSG
ncbi:hypothetical protein [Phaeobacter sp. B1627]|uniref:hypothetical protein n=1 Tax=Phaeobacter sp. B1627 TaxID=2583809 RepID=UPI001118A011|nr:hypothetical protein [Phaeobacter sp. B1627]TNJ44806.1 hypothetical protein FGE21_07185 [Phaeobacter sp. B1627]